jgi:uncharacterized ubiquitin-like protein YukD
MNVFILKCNKEHWGVSGLVLYIQGCRGYCLKNPDKGLKRGFKIPLTGFSNNGVSNYDMAVSRLHPICHQVHTSIHELTIEEFELKYKHHLKWMTKSQQLLQCFNLLKMPQAACLVTSLLLLTSTLERLLGDIFVTHSDETVTCPSLLKDLLKTEELRSVLGGSFMCCLEVFIGSPHGLNLRNLAWHGFLSEGELPTQYVEIKNIS